MICLQRNALIDDCLRRAGLEAVSEDEVLPLSVPEAILLLQRHERAKQGRARADHRRDMLARQVRDLSCHTIAVYGLVRHMMGQSQNSQEFRLHLMQNGGSTFVVCKTDFQHWASAITYNKY